MYKRNFYFLLALPVLLISCSKTDGSFSTINDSSQIPTAVESNSVNSALKKFNDGVIVEGIENQSFIVPSNSSMNQLNNYEQRIVYQQKDHIANETTMTKVGDPSTSSHFIYLRDEDGDATVETFAADNTITTTKVLTMNGYLSYDAYFYNPFLTLKEEDLTPYEDGTYAVEPTKAYYIVFALLGQQL